MINESTLDTLKAMHCSAMAEELSRQMQDPSTYSQLGFEERIGLIIDAEWNRRQKTKLTKLITKARFSLASSCVEGIEYLPDRKLDKAQILRFATCQYCKLENIAKPGRQLPCQPHGHCRQYLIVVRVGRNRPPDMFFPSHLHPLR